LSVMIDVFNMFVMPETPEDSKTMATKYDGYDGVVRFVTAGGRDL